LLPLIKASAPARLAQTCSRSISPRPALTGTGATVTCLHPATYMDTAMVRRAGVTSLSTAEEGAEAILNFAASPTLEGRTGRYFNGLREARARAQAYDAEVCRRLRAISLELTGLASDGLADAE
jgi:hypothetical protein